MGTTAKLTFLQREQLNTEDGVVRYDLTAETVQDLWDRYTPGSRLCACGCGVSFTQDKRLDGFRGWLREVLVDPDQAYDAVVCRDCMTPGLRNDDMEQVDPDDCPDDVVCRRCIGNHSSCEDCNRLTRYPTTTLAGYSICDGCRDNGDYNWCEDCGGYYHCDDSDAEEHRSHHACTCEAPGQEFTIRNDGADRVANDTRVTVALPAGTISAEGIGALSMLLRAEADRKRNLLRDVGLDMWTSPEAAQCDALWSLSYELGDLGDQWQTKDGNFAKRLSRHAYKTRSLKLTPALMSQVGTTAREHSTAVEFDVDFTRDLNQSAEYFYHEDSCWWGGYAESRCALKSNGGMGMRSFDEYGDVSGRVWVMPMKADEWNSLNPTFDTENPDALIVFNGYGSLSGYTPARILSHMTGWTYRKVNVYITPMSCNGGGYIVAPEELASRFTDSSFSLSVDRHSNLFQSESEARKVLTHV